MADDAHDALPRLALFLAQRARELRDDEQLVRLTALAEAAAANLPSPAAAGEHVRDDAARLLGEHAREAQLGRTAALQILAARTQQVLAGLIDDAKPKRHVEREHRDVDVGDDLLEQRAGLERLEPLIVERTAQRVDLDHDLAERVLGVDVTAAHGV